MIPRLNPATPSISAWEASAQREWTKLARLHGRRRTMFAQAQALIQCKMRQVSVRISRETGDGRRSGGRALDSSRFTLSFHLCSHASPLSLSCIIVVVARYLHPPISTEYVPGETVTVTISVVQKLIQRKKTPTWCGKIGTTQGNKVSGCADPATCCVPGTPVCYCSGAAFSQDWESCVPFMKLPDNENSQVKDTWDGLPCTTPRMESSNYLGLLMYAVDENEMKVRSKRGLRARATRRAPHPPIFILPSSPPLSPPSPLLFCSLRSTRLARGSSQPHRPRASGFPQIQDAKEKP